MSFANLFTPLCPVDEGVRSPCESAPPYRTSGEQKDNAKSGRGRKRKIWGEQHAGSNTKRNRHNEKATDQAKTTVTCHERKFSKGCDSNAQDYHIEKSDSKHTSTGFTKEHELCSYRGKSDQNKAKNNRTKNNHDVIKWQQQKKEHQNWRGERGRPGNRGGRRQSNRTADKRRGRSPNRGGKESVPVERKRLMTAEFKEQNAFIVDGRFLCRHFLWGRCIKGDDCQLEHVQGYNNLIKEACKFYIQGFCTKGEGCPYMHNSFPCKFFHGRGMCAQGGECKFSHEPLTTLTKELLEAALKKDSEFAKQAEEKALGQPKTTEVSVLTEENMILDNAKLDVLMYPIRPVFYSRSCPSEPRDEKEIFVCQADVTHDAVVPHATDVAQSHSPPSSDLIHKESVPYSVEAVLGSQRAKPFPSLFATPASQESSTVSTSQSSLDGPSSFADQSYAPYSVDAVLGSTKAACSHSSTPPSAQSIDYTAKPASSSTNQNEEVSHLLNVASESNKSMEKTFKNLSSSQVHACPISNFNSSAKTCTDLRTEQGRVTPESQKPALRASHMVKLDLLPPTELPERYVSSKTKADVKGAPGIQISPHLPTEGNKQLPRNITSLQDTTESQKPRDAALGCITEGRKSKDALSFGPPKPTRRVLHSLFSTPPSQTSAPKHPTQLKSHLSCTSSGSPDSTQSPNPSSGFTDSTVRAANSNEPFTSNNKKSVFVNSVTHQFVPKQSTNSKHHSLGAPSGLKGGAQDCTETTMDCHSKIHGVDPAGECSSTIKRPFHKLFASPITDCFVQLPCLQDTPDSVMTPSFPPDSFQSSHPATSSADCRGEDVHGKTAPEPGKATVSSFRSLFAGPISETADPLLGIQSQPDPPTPSSPQEPDQSAYSASGCKQRASDLETTSPQGLFSVSVHTGTPAVPTLPDVPTGQKGENGNGSHAAECINQSPKMSVKPACSLVLGPASDTTPAHSDASLDPSIAQAQLQLPDVSSQTGSSERTTANSVLKTLFVALSPFQQDVEQQGNIDISVHLEQRLMRLEEEKIDEVERIKEKPKEENMDPHRQLKGSCKQAAEKTVAHPDPGGHRLSLQNCQIPLETRGGSNSSCPGTSQAQVRTSGIHNLPITPMALLTQPCTRLPLKQTSGQKKCVKGKVGVTPLKDLFKSLNPTASPFGH